MTIIANKFKKPNQIHEMHGMLSNLKSQSPEWMKLQNFQKLVISTFLTPKMFYLFTIFYFTDKI